MKPASHVYFPRDHHERAVFSVSGAIEVDGILYPASELLVLKPGRDVLIHAPEGARVLLFGGEPLDAPRYLWWNFVSSDKDRIEQAKSDWLQGNFDRVTGDDEYIPLPDE